jgi:hypothetical protein
LQRRRIRVETIAVRMDGAMVGVEEIMEKQISPGDLFDTDGSWRIAGRYIVVEPNNSRESPRSWVMRRIRDGKTAYMHESSRLRGEWIRVGALRRLRTIFRNSGLASFGFSQEDFRHHHQLLRVWGPLNPAHWEVWRWEVGTVPSDADNAIEPLRFGSLESYHRIGFMAERVYVGNDWKDAKAAMRGVYGEPARGSKR